MEIAARRHYAAAGAALLAAGLIAVIPAVAPIISTTHVQSPAVELAATADAFLDLANALDPSASSDGLIGVANNLDSFLDLFGNPTVNVADTLATDFIGFLDLGSSVNSIPTILDAIDSDLTSGLLNLGMNLGNDFGSLEVDLNTGFSTLAGDLNTGFSTLDTDLGSITSALGGLDTINTSINTLDTDLNSVIGGLDTLLSNDLSPLTDIANDLGGGGVIAGELASILDVLIASE